MSKSHKICICTFFALKNLIKKTQRFNSINRIKKTKLLNFRNKTKKTWIEQNMTSESARKHLLTLSRRPTFHQYIGTTENGDEERITWIAVDFYLNVSKNTPAFTMYLDHYLVWKSFVNDINSSSQ